MRYCPSCPPEKGYHDHLTRCPEHGVRLTMRDPYRLTGTIINGKYRVEALLGIGGMGAVYLVTHTGINRQMAFKLLKPDLCAQDPTVIESFRREATIAGGLSHPNIVNVTDADLTNDGMAFMVMELLECPTLEDELAKESVFSLRRSEHLLEQICNALHAAHSHQIIHRDLKPANIAVLPGNDGHETIKVLDFGIAKSIAEGAGKVSQAMGTPIYASPEQFSPGVLIDGRSDLYSLGIMTFQMLTGNLPFRGKTVGEIVRLHLATSPPPLTKFKEDIPKEVEAVVLRALAKRPDDRQSSALEFHAQFRQAVANALPGLLAEVPYTVSNPVGIGMKETVMGGKVTLLISGAPPSAEVKVNDWPRGSVDETGSMMITDLSGGNHKVSVRKAGFESWTMSFSCQPGERKDIRVSMRPMARPSGAYPGLGHTQAAYDEHELAVTQHSAYPTSQSSVGMKTAVAPPPGSYAFPPKPYQAPKKNWPLIIMIITCVAVFGAVGVVYISKNRAQVGGTPTTTTESTPVTKTKVTQAYRDTVEHVTERVNYAADNVPTGGFGSIEQLRSARNQIDLSRASVANANHDLEITDPSDELKTPHEQLRNRYDNLVAAMDRYNLSLRSLDDALSSKEYNAGENENTRGQREKEQAARDQAAFIQARQEAKNAERQLKGAMR
ncbi:MAG: protein kinase [Blastocatellia bacterium]|nr:protein kinase [Blastocatellia bacterium]